MLKIDLPDATVAALRELARIERRDSIRDLVESLVITSMYRRHLVSRNGLEQRRSYYPEDPESSSS